MSVCLHVCMDIYLEERAAKRPDAAEHKVCLVCQQRRVLVNHMIGQQTGQQVDKRLDFVYTRTKS